MTVVCDDIIEQWEVVSFNDFGHTFKIEEELLKEFPDVEEFDDIYDSEYFGCDEDHIIEWLDKSNRLFRVTYEHDRHDGYFRISEISGRQL